MPELDPAFRQRREVVMGLLAEYERLATTNRSEVDTWVSGKLHTILSFALGNSAWWRDHLGLRLAEVSPANALELLRQLPVLTRATIQQNTGWMRIWVPGSHAGAYQAVRTSGSTGKPVEVLKHGPTYNAGVHAVTLLDIRTQGRDVSLPVASIRASSAPAEVARLGEPYSYLGETGLAYGFKMSGTTAAEGLQFLAQHEVGSLVSNATILKYLAREQAENPRPLKLNHIMNWAERLTPEVRELVESAFGARVYDRYSSEELGMLAIQCPQHNHLHAVEPFNHIEILSDDGEPCGVGEVGRVVVTALHNLAQPMIRYELGDLASWGESCDVMPGFRVINPEIVRRRESFVTESGELVMPNATGSLIGKSADVRDFQVFRFQDAVVTLYQAEVDFDDAKLREFGDDLRLRFNTTDPAHFVRVSASAEFKLLKRTDFIAVPKTFSPEINPDELIALI